MNSFAHKPNKEGAIRILQITDPHLFADPNGTLLGVNTAQSFQAVIDAILESGFNYDFILATGDLTQDHNSDSYFRFAEMMHALTKPVFWVEGNHDLSEMKEILSPHPHIRSEKHILAGDNWQLFLLNSQVFGLPHGNLNPYQLEWLNYKLGGDNAKKNTMIVMHHNILPTHSSWLDQHSLRSLRELEDVLSPYKNVKAIVHGHIHQEVDDLWNGIRVLSTPSTCIQFKPNSNRFTLDMLAPGWREITLHPNGEITTQVKRLKENNFLPDFESDGY